MSMELIEKVIKEQIKKQIQQKKVNSYNRDLIFRICSKDV